MWQYVYIPSQKDVTFGSIGIPSAWSWSLHILWIFRPSFSQQFAGGLGPGGHHAALSHHEELDVPCCFSDSEIWDKSTYLDTSPTWLSQINPGFSLNHLTPRSLIIYWPSLEVKHEVAESMIGYGYGDLWSIKGMMRQQSLSGLHGPQRTWGWHGFFSWGRTKGAEP